MVTRFRWALLAGAALAIGCASQPSDSDARTSVSASQHDTAAPAIAALRSGDFDKADQLARERMAADDRNPYPRLVRAITRYKKSMQQLAIDGRTVLIGGLEAGGINQRYLHTTFAEAESELAAVEADLAFVARHQGISLELCLACWEIDWNGNGRIDERDQRLFEIEQDARGEPLADDDPRRKPTFRFDDGDVAWARAFVSFERAALDVALAYDWSDVGKLARRRRERPDQVVVKLVDRDRIEQARLRLLEGLNQSDACRRAYLAETDDDREWVPNPRQKSHPMPLPVDQSLYDTWEGVVGDVRALARGDEGLHIATLFEALGEGIHNPPKGYLDVGRMLAHPKDIVLDLKVLGRLKRDEDIEGAMSAAFGEYYVREMKPSALPGRLARMKGEIDRNEEGFGRKLRYLLWLN
ncbi:MAG: hypothetical protein QM820_32575 [Minicystis sp.]